MISLPKAVTEAGTLLSMRRTLLAILMVNSLGAILLQAPTFADVLILKNGRTLNGQITFQDQRLTFITLYAGGELILRNEEIASAAVSVPTASPTLIPVTPTIPPGSLPESTRVPSAPTATPSRTPSPSPTLEPTPHWLRPIRFRLLDKQELRTLLARRFVYHLIIEETTTPWETKQMLIRLMDRYRKEEKWADAIEIRFYGIDSKGKRYEWPFAVADYAPEGDWSKAAASSPRSRFLLRLKINNQVEYLRP